MKVESFGHVSVNALDIEESLKFYREVMGMELIKTTDMGAFTLYWMKVNDDEFVELFDWRGEKKHDPKSEATERFIHMAFNVEDIEGWFEHLKKHNIKFSLELKPLEKLGVYAIMFEDPNGAMIELNQPI